jgi:hypothetical protein
MTKLRYFVFCSVLLALASCESTVNATLEDGMRGRAELRQQVLNLLEQRAYPQLENMISEADRNKTRLADGGWKANAIYMAFSEGERTDDQWRTLIKQCESWLKASPQSAISRTALASAWYGYGWQARGHKTADTVTEQRWTLFRERLGRAYELAGSPADRNADCPERFNILLRLAGALGLDDARYWQIYHEAFSYAPDYDPYYITATIHLLPRWGGAPGDWLRFAIQSSDSAPSDFRDIRYFLIMSRIQQFGEIQSLKDSGVSWERLQSGYRDLARLLPKSDWNENRLALFACLADDRNMLRKIMERNGFTFQFDAWSGVDPNACRVKSGLPEFHTMAVQETGVRMDSVQQRIFRETYVKAEKGDHIAMAMVGEMCLRGEGVERNAVQAYAWLALSGKNNKLLAEATAALPPELQLEARKEAERLRLKLQHRD